MTNYYSILGVAKTATQEEIKLAYRKLAMKFHPDRTGGDDTEFKKIQEAYATLGDESARSNYDSPGPQTSNGFGGMPRGFEDFLAQFGHFGRFGSRNTPTNNKSVSIQSTITLEDAFHGRQMIATVTLPSGKEQIIDIKIPAGIQDGTNIRLSGLGDDTNISAARGDIIIHVRVSNNTKFTRNGDDLLLPIEISMWDAVLGSTVLVETIDKKNLEIKINPGTQHGQLLAVSGAGMPNVGKNDTRGRLLLQVSVKIPTLLTEEQRTLIEKSKPNENN